MAKVDIAARRVQRLVHFDAGLGAVLDFVLLPGERYAFLSAYDANEVLLLDLETPDAGKQVVKVIETGFDPMYMAASPDKRWIFCANLTSDNIAVIDSRTNSLVKLIPVLFKTPEPLNMVGGVVNAASLQSGPIAPGEIVTLFGSGLGPPAPAGAQFGRDGLLPSLLADTRVRFDGTPAPLIYVSASQWNAIIPYGLSARARARVQIEHLGDRSTSLEVPVGESAPGIFTMGSTGRGQGAILNQDGTVNSAENPAPKDSVISLFATGEGQTNPAGVDGKRAVSPLPRPVLPIVVGINNAGAEILYTGAAPGLAAGVMQVNVRVPKDAPGGNAVPIVLRVGDSGLASRVSLSP